MTEASPEIVDLAPQQAIAVRGDVAIGDLPSFFERAFHEAFDAASACGVEIVGPPFGFYPEMPAGTVAVEAGFPVSAPAEVRGSTHPFVLPGGRAARVTHIGPYETLEATYRLLQAWMAEHGLVPATGMWECYLSDPETEPDPAGWRTQIIWPLTG